jgi:hypothetical protein
MFMHVQSAVSFGRLSSLRYAEDRILDSGPRTLIIFIFHCDRKVSIPLLLIFLNEGFMVALSVFISLMFLA